VSALSEEFQEARRLLQLAGRRSLPVEERAVVATMALAHATLATAAPGTASEARYNEDEGIGDHGQAAPD
jgi:hypothetical protein